MPKLKKKRVYEAVIFPTTNTTKIMDEFNAVDANYKYLYDTMRLSLSGKTFCIGDEINDIEFIIGREGLPWEVDSRDNGIILSDLVKGQVWTFSEYVMEYFPSPKEFLDKIERDIDFYFNKPLLLRAQSSNQHGKGCTYGGAIPYGQTNSYAIKGIQRRLPYNALMHKKIKYINLYPVEDTK